MQSAWELFNSMSIFLLRYSAGVSPWLSSFIYSPQVRNRPMHLRSGKTFVPYALKRIFGWDSAREEPLSTLVDAEPLIQIAAAREDERFEQGADDSEGLGVSLRPLSPLTEFESDDEANVPDQPPQSVGPNSGAGSVEKKRRNAATSKRRSKKRARIASSGHGPHVYAAKPSTATHHAKAQSPLEAPTDAESFPASSSGSWVGRRSKGAKNKPWTMPELLDAGFSAVEWDGR
jgi:hypothetical protein